MSSNLPTNKDITDSAEKTKTVFNNYGTKQYEFTAVEVDATLAFFIKRGFEDDAAESVATLLLTQAKIENVSVMSILDTINNIDEAQLSVFVSQVLNNGRVQTSTLGFRVATEVTNQTRNILE